MRYVSPGRWANATGPFFLASWAWLCRSVQGVGPGLPASTLQRRAIVIPQPLRFLAAIERQDCGAGVGVVGDEGVEELFTKGAFLGTHVGIVFTGEGVPDAG